MRQCGTRFCHLKTQKITWGLAEEKGEKKCGGAFGQAGKFSGARKPSGSRTNSILYALPLSIHCRCFSQKKKKSFSSITSGEFHPSSFNIIRRELKREPWKVSRRRCPSPLINRWAWTWPWTEIPMLLFFILLSSKKLYFHILIQARIMREKPARVLKGTSMTTRDLCFLFIYIEPYIAS